jgi:opacity protein-like surface antigen
MTLSTLRRAAGLSGLLIVAGMALTTPALAQQKEQSTGLGIRGIGVRLGLTDPEDASSALMYGVHLDAGQFVQNVHIVPSIEYWSVGTDLGAFNSDFSDLAFKVDAKFDFPLQDKRVMPYLGGGIGIHRLKFDTSAPGPYDTSDTKLGLSVQGGVRNDFTPNLSLFGELGYSFVSDANQLRLLGGFTYHFIY